MSGGTTNPGSGGSSYWQRLVIGLQRA
jgi:hypothetical protein